MTITAHVMGDDCLRRVASALALEIRSEDLLARYGGEEFAAILSDRTEEEAMMVAERLRTAVLWLALPNEGAGTGAVVHCQPRYFDPEAGKGAQRPQPDRRG